MSVRCQTTARFTNCKRSSIHFFKKADIYGHVRVRQETSFERNTGPTRNRQRLRARLGVRYAHTGEWESGLRMTTGDRKLLLDPRDRRGAPLSYQDTGDVLDKFEFNLDRIYTKYSPAWLPGVWSEVGKFNMPMKFNPITKGPIGTLLWDEAAHPEGFAVGFESSDVPELDAIQAVIGDSAVLELSGADEASLFFTQVYGAKRLGPVTAGAGLAYFGWHNLNPDSNFTISSENNFGNAVRPVVPGSADLEFLSEFNILNPLIVLSYDEDSCGFDPLEVVAEFYKNTTSFDRERDFGYVLGVSYGPGITSKEKWNWKIYYLWAEVQQESVFTPASQDDLQQATNFRAQIFGLMLYLFSNSDVHLWFLSDEPLDPLGGSKKPQWRFRADITLRF